MRILSACLVAVWGMGLASAAAQEKPPEPGRMVTVEVAIVEFSGEDAAEPRERDSAEALIGRIRELEKAGKLDSLTRVRLTSLEEQTARVQTGEQVAVPSGRNFFGGREGFSGRDAQTVFSRQDVGLMVSTTTRVADDGRIIIELSVQRSRLRPVRDGEPSDESDSRDRPPRSTETLTVQSTLRVPDGKTVVAQSTEARAGNARTRQVILVTAQVDDGDRKTAKAEPQKPDALRAFALKQVAADSAASMLKDVYRDQKELRFEADPRTQTVIMTGPRELLEEIEELLQRIDEQPKEKAAPKKAS